MYQGIVYHAIVDIESIYPTSQNPLPDDGHLATLRSSPPTRPAALCANKGGLEN